MNHDARPLPHGNWEWTMQAHCTRHTAGRIATRCPFCMKSQAMISPLNSEHAPSAIASVFTETPAHLMSMMAWRGVALGPGPVTQRPRHPVKQSRTLVILVMMSVKPHNPVGSTFCTHAAPPRTVVRMRYTCQLSNPVRTCSGAAAHQALPPVLCPRWPQRRAPAPAGTRSIPVHPCTR